MSAKNALGRTVLLALALTAFQSAQAAMINGGFELPSLTPGVASFNQINQTTVPGWRTTASDGLIEIWSDGFGGFASYQGLQHAEINATQVGTLYQDVPGIAAGVLVGFQFAHRGRYTVPDVMQFTLTDLGANNTLGGGDDTVLYTQTVSGTNSGWSFYTGSGITTLGNTVRFSYATVSGSVPAGGNFIDAAAFGVGVGGPATITVNKDFSPNNAATVPVALTCTSGTVTTTPLNAAEGAPAVFTVTGASAGATCTATETVPAGYTANQAGCVGVALNGSCTITNTLVGATSIPTLSEWAMIMLAGLLALFGFVALRRQAR